MAKLRYVQFANESACIDDVKRLEKGCKQGGNWSLGQACFHLNLPLESSLDNQSNASATPEQLQRQGFIDQVIASGWPAGTISPKEMVPPSNPGNTVEKLVASLKRFESYKAPQANTFVFGPVDTDKFRKFILIHAGHHLSFFEPA